mmetsp:Transcript_10387/g.12397  ORF Transcript_10387/g.12397 Transcript_10387/m.12397 type:complete len:87 (+) Transcript_10387:80-340(+)
MLVVPQISLHRHATANRAIIRESTGLYQTRPSSTDTDLTLFIVKLASLCPAPPPKALGTSTTIDVISALFEYSKSVSFLPPYDLLS